MLQNVVQILDLLLCLQNNPLRAVARSFTIWVKLKYLSYHPAI